jgi:threonine synthase
VGIVTRMGRLMRRALHDDELLAEWADSEPGSYEAALEEFERLLAEGHTAVRVEGAEHHPVTTLPADAELVLLTTAMGGG